MAPTSRPRKWVRRVVAGDVTFTLAARRTGNVIAVQGDEPITFSDHQINNPSGGPANVGNSGQLEFVLQFQPS